MPALRNARVKEIRDRTCKINMINTLRGQLCLSAIVQTFLTGAFHLSLTRYWAAFLELRYELAESDELIWSSLREPQELRRKLLSLDLTSYRSLLDLFLDVLMRHFPLKHIKVGFLGR